MKSLEFEGIYDLVIPGNTMPECKQLPQIYNSSPRLFNILAMLFGLIARLCRAVFLLASSLVYYLTSTSTLVTRQVVDSQQINQQLAERIRQFNHEWRSKNSHCFYFGIYSFNLTRWKTLDSSRMHTWCNSSGSNINPGLRRYLAGYVRHSNLIMLVVEDEFELFHCGNMSQYMQTHLENKYGNSSKATATTTATTTTTTAATTSLEKKAVVNKTSSSGDDDTKDKDKDEDDEELEEILRLWNQHQAYISAMSMLSNTSGWNGSSTRAAWLSSSAYLTSSQSTPAFTWSSTLDFIINRYRKKPDVCYNYFENEREFLPCHSGSQKRLRASFYLLLVPILVLAGFRVTIVHTQPPTV